MRLLVLLLACAHAHVPVFDDNLAEKNVQDKSWGVYTSLEKGESFRVWLDVPQGDNVSFSVNLAGSQAFKAGTKYVDVSISGHNASDIPCDPSFTGWRRLDALLDSTQHLHVETEDKPLVFEPFGVGYYRPLASCQAPVPVPDTFWVDILALEDVTLSIGAGMAESFSVAEILFMPFTILRTWAWDGYVGVWAIVTLLNVTCLFVARYFVTAPLEVAVLVFGIGFNIMHYVFRLIALHTDMYSESERDKKGVEIACLLHIGLPCVALASLWFRRLRFDAPNALCDVKVWARVLMLVYAASLLWQGYHIITVYYIGVVFAPLVVEAFANVCNCCTTRERYIKV